MTVLLVRDPSFSDLKEFVIATTGLAYYAEKEDDLAARIGRRVARVGAKDAASYLGMLRDPLVGPGEIDALITELTIGETYFFRHQELFDALRDIVLPDLIAQKQGSRSLRIWSAGCATGAEPYSLSMLLRREFASRIKGWQITILGTDINRDFLTHARAGRFEEWTLRETSEAMRQSCFQKKDRDWIVAPEYREGVFFEYHNLVAQPFPSLLNEFSNFDLVMCRNVMIYFSRPIIRKLVNQFYQCLIDGGWLAVGHAESSIELFCEFHTVNADGATLYQKRKRDVPDISASISPRGVSKEPAASPPEQCRSRPTKDRNLSPEPMGLVSLSGVQEEIRRQDSATSLTLADIRILASRGNYEKALSCCDTLSSKEKLNPFFYFYQGLICEHLGHQEEAVRALHQAIYLDQNFVLAHYYQGLFSQKKQDIRGARRHFQNALRLLSRMDGNEAVDDGNEIRAEDLKKLTEMHLEALHGL